MVMYQRVNPGPPALKASTLPLSYRGGRIHMVSRQLNVQNGAEVRVYIYITDILYMFKARRIDKIKTRKKCKGLMILKVL